MLIGASLSKPHTSGTALQEVCVCWFVCMFVHGHIQEFKLNERIRTFQICTRAKARLQPVGMKEACGEDISS